MRGIGIVNWTNGLLIALCVGFGGALYWEINGDDTREGPVTDVVLNLPNAAEAMDAVPIVLPRRDAFREADERPLFSSDRRPAKQKPEVSKEPQDVGLTVVGVIIDGSTTIALAKRKAEKNLVRLRVGDQVSGWSVEQILADRVVMRRAQEIAELPLIDPKRKPDLAGSKPASPAKGTVKPRPALPQTGER
jgi:hypothetical protein